MSKDWKAFLKEKGTQFSNPELEKPPLAQGAMLIGLTNIGIIKVSGEDAESFLQNQLTNDIRNVTDTNHQTSAWCSPKGRIIASFQISKYQNSYILTISADLLEHVIKKLSMYIMMSKVTIEDATDSYALFVFSGEKADKQLQQMIGSDYSLPTEPKQSITYNNLQILQIPTTIPSYMIIGDIDEAKQLWTNCSSTATVTNDSSYSYLNILSGYPVITAPSSEKWIPQMVNFIAIGGVDFKKGCYPGQEVVARLNYLGKTKRRMYRIEIDSQILPEVNDNIGSDSDNTAGQILNAVFNPEGKVEALAILKIAEAEKQLILASNEAKISILDLPYTLEI